MKIFENVQWKIQSVTKDKRRALIIAYVDARDVAEALDELYPEWQDTYTYLGAYESNGERVHAVECTLTIKGIVRRDVGEGVTFKGAYSDALKRAAVKFGIGRYLYSLPSLWVDLDPNKPDYIPQAGLDKANQMYRDFVAQMGATTKVVQEAPKEQKKPGQTQAPGQPTPHTKHHVVLSQFKKIGLDTDEVRPHRLRFLSEVLGRNVTTANELDDNDLIRLTAATRGVLEAIGERQLTAQDWERFWKWHTAMGFQYSSKELKAMRESITADWQTFLGE